MQKFDLIIIGGGAGAFAAAIKANELKAKTALVNSGLPLGGTCVNVGCVPSKTLLWAGEVMHQAENHGIPGIELERKKFDFKTVVQDELALVEKLRTEKYEKVLKHLEHVTFIDGKAKFTSTNAVEVDGEELSAEKFIIAAGSSATAPPIEGIEETGYITHVEALKLEKQPKELVVIGAGAVGLEFAQMYARFGTKVTLLQRGPVIFPPGEKELTDHLITLLVKDNIDVVINADVSKTRTESGKKVVEYMVDGEQYSVSADEVLMATGKTPNTGELGLDVAGVAVNERKAVKVSPTFGTSQENISAVGDVTDLPLRLETTAGREGSLAAENVLSGAKNSIDYNSVPYTVFTDPQYASVGFTEDQQMNEMGVCACRTVSFADVPKGVITHRTEGMIKMAIHPKTQQIMGVHILAPNAGDLIAQAMVLIKNKNTIDDVTDSMPVFPTMSEAIKIVALSFTRDISQLSCCI